MKQGLFITVEGPEGAGKTSVMKSVISDLLELGYDIVATREPGGIRISEEIREIILDNKNVEMDARTEALLYAAARRQHLVEKVLPALAEGKIVICDRFVDASLAYQGYARGIGIDEVWSINEFAIQTCMPNKTLLFDLDPKIGLERIAANEQRENNRLDNEKLSFHQLVREGYHILRDKDPERFSTINAEQSEFEVTKEVFNIVKDYIDQS